MSRQHCHLTIWKYDRLKGEMQISNSRGQGWVEGHRSVQEGKESDLVWLPGNEDGGTGEPGAALEKNLEIENEELSLVEFVDKVVVIGEL